MLLRDILSWYDPQPGDAVALDVATYHTKLLPECKFVYKEDVQNNAEMYQLVLMITDSWSDDINDVPCPL